MTVKNGTKKTGIGRLLGKYWVTIWLVTAFVLLFTVIVSQGAYTHSNHKIKRVVAPSASTEGLFTSNYLKLGTTALQYAYCDGSVLQYDVIIRNYNPADQSTVYEGDLSYTLNVTVAHKSGAVYDSANDANWLSNMRGSITVECGNETITINSSTPQDVSQPHTLSGSGESGKNTWTVTYSGITKDDDYCVNMVAVPLASGVDQLSATIIATTTPKINHEGWSCELAEKNGSGTVDDYDGFNYTISGTGAKILKFSYDSTHLEINPAFYAFSEEYDGVMEISAPAEYSGDRTDITAADWRTVVIRADPETTGNDSYDFQVYKVGGYQPESFDDVDPDPENTGSIVEFTSAN